jgi:ESS family glutamate:Na+ symporter
LIGQATRGMFNSLRKRGIMTHQYVNNYLMGRISGFAFDLMVIAGIATININDLSGLWLPFWLMAVLGAIVTLIYLQWLCRHLYPDYYDEGLLSMYGMLVGNISSGMMLLREIDPDFRSPAAGNLVSGTSFAILLGAPLLILIGLAPQSDLMVFVTMGLLLIYMVPLILFILKGKRKAVAPIQKKKA